MKVLLNHVVVYEHVSGYHSLSNFEPDKWIQPVKLTVMHHPVL